LTSSSTVATDLEQSLLRRAFHLIISHGELFIVALKEPEPGDWEKLLDFAERLLGGHLSPYIAWPLGLLILITLFLMIFAVAALAVAKLKEVWQSNLRPKAYSPEQRQKAANSHSICNSKLWRKITQRTGAISSLQSLKQRSKPKAGAGTSGHGKLAQMGYGVKNRLVSP
jgi:hypothetical protein